MEHAELFGVLYIFIKFPHSPPKKIPYQDDTHDSPDKFLTPPKKNEVSIFFFPP